MKEGYDVVVVANMLMDRHLHLELTSANSAMASGIFLVDELDGENRVVFADGTGFLDAGRRDASVSGVLQQAVCKP